MRRVNPTVVRSRSDRCPGALRPWPAEDGLLVRLRLVGGRVPTATLRALVEVAEEHGDGHVHLTSRANLQLRGLRPASAGAESLTPEALAAIEGTGLLPSRTHELVRNVMVSPLGAGVADLRPAAEALDRLLLADPDLGALPGRFLFVLDDGTGDLLDRPCDLGLVALDAMTAQLRVGDDWGDVLPLDDAPQRIADLARGFLRARGAGAGAAWHVRELAVPLTDRRAADPRVPAPSAPPPYGPVPGGVHLEVPESGLDRTLLASVLAPEVVVTPWRGLFVPEETSL